MDKASNSLSQTPPRPNGSPWRRPIVDHRRTMISVFAMRDARQIIRDDLKRRNCKPSHYAQREICEMALRYGRDHWRELEARALAKIMGDAG